MASNIPVIVQGNSFSLAIPLQIYIIDEGEMVLEDYTPDPTDEVSVQLKGSRRNYTYTPTIDGNVANIDLTGNELADNYGVVVSVVKANGQRLRSFRTDQFFIVESSDDLTPADIIEGLEENVIYLNAQPFIAGADGRGIESIVKTGTSGLVDTYTITYTDATTSTFDVTNGANGAQGAQGADGVGITSIEKTSTSGLVDTYTITLSNGETSTFEVTNGKDGVDLGLATIVDNLTEGGSTNVLSAEQGKILGQRTEYPMEMVQPSESGAIRPTTGLDWGVGGWWHTPYTRIDPTKPIYAKGDSNNASVAFVAFYDDNLVCKGTVSKLGAAGVEYEVQVPEGATCARVVCTTAQKETSYLTQKVQRNLNDVVVEHDEVLNEVINLIDLVKSFTVGYLQLNTGVQMSQLYRTTDYIFIDDSLDITIFMNARYGTPMDVISFYSDKKDTTYLGGLHHLVGNTDEKHFHKLVIPQGAKWMRVCADSVAYLQTIKLMVKQSDYTSLQVDALANANDYNPARFLLPTNIDVVVGRQCDFFVQDTIYNLNKLPYVYNLPSSITDYGKGHLRINASGTGTDQITLKTYKQDQYINDYLVGTQTINVRKVAKSGMSGTYNVLIVGDSLVQYGPNPAETYRLLNEDGDVTINQIGTNTQTLDGVTYRHQGEGGWTWARFNSGSDSPFVFNGELSFAQYMATNFPTLSGIDLCVVMLGTNDTESLVLNGAKTFVDALLADYPNCKIAIGIPAYGRPCEGMPTAMERKLRYEAYVYLNTFDNGKYNANVTCIGQGCWIDRVNDYQHEEADSTPYSTDKFIRYTDGVHPRTQGYKQWGRAVYCKIRSWIAGNL